MILSFIIPVFNGADFIVRCLDSIYEVRMPKDEFEIIVVDDCSMDCTREIVNEYISSHPQVRLLCQRENHRQGAARNRGLKEAKGDYIAFVDADDIVLSGFYDSYKLLSTNTIDMVYGYMEVEKEDMVYMVKNDSIPAGIITGAAFAERYYNQGVFLYPPSYVYRRQFLLDIDGFFVEDRQHEDRDWLANVLSKAGAVIVNPVPTYRYVNNPFSTCRQPRYSTVMDHVASGIRHIRLSEQLSEKCPNLSKTLYLFGRDEIYKSLRLRNLSKYPWSENKRLYDSKHLKPLLPELRLLFHDNKIAKQTFIVLYMIPVELLTLLFAFPIADIFRKIVSMQRH